MALIEISEQTGTHDLTGAGATVLAATAVSAGEPVEARVMVDAGSGANPLEGQGELTMRILVGGVRVVPDFAFTIIDGQMITVPDPLIVPAGETVAVELESDEAYDTSVDVTARLYEVPAPSVIPFTVDDSDFSPTVRAFETGDAAVQADDGFWIGKVVEFRSGSLAGQQRPVVGSEVAITNVRLLTLPFTAEPGSGDEAIIKL